VDKTFHLQINGTINTLQIITVIYVFINCTYNVLGPADKNWMCTGNTEHIIHGEALDDTDHLLVPYTTRT
jgi:hypothetical protein